MHLGAPRDRGVLVDAVVLGTLAAKIGLKVGDLVLDIDNTPIASTRDVIAAIGKHKKGDKIVLDVMRTGIPATLRTTLDQDPPPVRAIGVDTDRGPATMPAPGASGDLERQLRQQLDEMRRRLDEMERRFDPAKPTPPPADGT